MRAKGLKKDYTNIALLLLLYTLQGLPLGLASTIDLTLQELKLSFEQQGIFSLVFLPFSVKLAWAPLVDSIYLKKIGRRKSWLIPIQFLLGLLLIQSSKIIPQILAEDEIDVFTVTAYMTTFCFLAATQDIAVDGWAVSLLDPENVGYASTCNTIGQTIGGYIGFTGFLVLRMYNILDLEGFMYYCGLVFLIVTLIIAIFKSEKIEKEDNNPKETVAGTYMQMIHVCSLPAVRKLVFYTFTMKAIYTTCDVLTMRKLIEQDFPKELAASLAIVSGIVSLLVPTLLSKQISSKPVQLLTKTLFPRILLYFGSILIVSLHPEFHELDPEEGLFAAAFGSTFKTTVFFLFLILFIIIQTIFGTLFFVSSMGFYASIADERIGGTYMTLLNTLNNLAGTLPTQFVLFAVNKLSIGDIDGFYVLSMSSFFYGLIWLSQFKSGFLSIAKIPLHKWRYDPKRELRKKS
eukprot:maker-scaffold_4-snap-gene-2.49-mRNA-1 protein AED:0.01 eAED:0.01 QI:208/1/1/1/1/1/3/110/460